jgi:hypothetical protein
MGNPQCPIHNKEMRAGNKGGFYCPTKVGDSWCSMMANNDGNVYEKQPRSGGSAPTGSTSKPTSRRSEVDWEQLGKVKALCGMANAMLAFGKKPVEVIAELPALENLLAAIEAKAKPTPAATSTRTHGADIQIDNSDIPF